MVAATSLRYFQQASALGLSSASAPSVESVEELTCPTTEIQFMGLTLRQPTVIPVCWLAGLIGIIGFFQLRKTRVTGNDSLSNALNCNVFFTRLVLVQHFLSDVWDNDVGRFCWRLHSAALSF